MTLRKTSLTAALFAGLFLLSGILRVVTYRRELCEGFSQLFCGALLLVWAVSVQARVTDRRLRRLLLCTVASLLLFLVLQTCRGNLTFGNPVLERYTWYGYYIPYIGSPLLAFLCALAAWRPREQPLPSWAWAVVGLTAALSLAALTNDLHQLTFRFPDGVFQDTDIYSPGPFFFLYFGCYGVLLLAGFVIVVVKAWRIRRGLSFLLPTIPPVLLAVWMILNQFNAVPAIGGVKLWIESDSFCFAFAAYLEMCIQIGLIPANSSYGPLFSRLELSAAILDREDRPAYQSGGVPWPFPEDPALELRQQPIPGGSVAWATDLGPILALNRQLKDAARDLDQRNAFLREENRLKKEKTELEFRTRLYERISRVLEPQLERMETLAQARGDALCAKLPELCLLTTFVKRRSNMELLRSEGSLSAEELSAALAETAEALQSCGVEAAMGPWAAGTLPDQAAIGAYEFCFSLLSGCLPELRSFYARITGETGSFTLRLLLGLPEPARVPVDSPLDSSLRLRVGVEDGALVFTLGLSEGGA